MPAVPVVRSRTVACIGVGQVGRGWVVVFARAGFKVRLYDPDTEILKTALEVVRTCAEVLAESGDIPSAEELCERVEACESPNEAVRGCEYVQESITEDLDSKRRLFKLLDSATSNAADVIFGSSTSSIAGSAFLEGLTISKRCMVVHPTNPPYFVPLTEVCRTESTSEESFRRCWHLLEEIGQVPVLIRREIPGFVLNRLQAAVVGEALHLVGEGVISARDLDRTMANGLGLRWAFMGPFLTGHLNATGGYAHYMSEYGSVYKELSRSLRVDYPWSDALIAAIDSELRNMSSGRSIEEQQAKRDRTLAGLRRYLDHVQKEGSGAQAARENRRFDGSDTESS